jgi:hypothetical protein
MGSRGATGLGYGLVSGIQNQMIRAPTRATEAMLRNTIDCPKLTAMRPNSAVLSEAPIPDCARVKGSHAHMSAGYAALSGAPC